MFNFFDQVVNILQLFYQFMQNMFHSLLQIFKFITFYLTFNNLLQGFVPSILVLSIILVSGISVAKLLLGR